jgi:hypothetical protein
LILQRVFRHLRVFLRVEVVIAETRLRLAMRRSALLAVAGLIAAFGLAMLNVVVFLVLEAPLGPVWAALVTAGGDFVLALIIVAIAMTGRPGPDLHTALELRQAAIDGIEGELSALQDGFSWLSRAARDPFDIALPAILVPLVTAIIRGLRKSKPDGQ